jgi:hypothetical protein
MQQQRQEAQQPQWAVGEQSRRSICHQSACELTSLGRHADCSRAQENTIQTRQGKSQGAQRDKNIRGIKITTSAARRAAKEQRGKSERPRSAMACNDMCNVTTPHAADANAACAEGDILKRLA